MSNPSLSVGAGDGSKARQGDYPTTAGLPPKRIITVRSQGNYSARFGQFSYSRKAGVSPAKIVCEPMEMVLVCGKTSDAYP